MNREFPIERLKALQSIQPDPVFLKWSKRAIFENATQSEPKYTLPRRISLTTVLTRAIRPLVATGTLAAVAFVIITMRPGAAPDAIASLNGASIATEQRALATETKTAETHYFKGVSPTISLALTDIIDPSTDYGSVNHIKKGIALLQTRNE